jgi:hypothetical protein
MEIRDQQRRQSITPNWGALLALCALACIWTALSPIWVPCLVWLFSFFEPVLSVLGKVFLGFAALSMIVVVGLAVALVAAVLGGGIPHRLR